MELWDSLTKLFQRDAQHLDRPIIANDHIVPPLADAGPIAGGEGYFQLWVVTMFLKNDREWFKSWYPVVQSLTRFRFGNLPNPIEIAQIAGPGYLKNVAPQNLDRVIQVDFPLTPLVPFSGGTVQVEVGLVAMQASDMLKTFLDVMGNFAGLLAVPQLSTAVNVASAVSNGVNQLLGFGEKRMVLGYQRTYTGAGDGGDNELRAGYVVLLNAPAGDYKPDYLWVKDGKLLYGNSAADSSELTGVDYMLLRIGTRRTRDDWDALTTINEPFNKAIDSLSRLDATGNPNVAEAETFVRMAAAAALSSPDLTNKDRIRVARAIRDRYNEYKSALLGEERSLRAPAAPTITEVADRALDMADTPVTLAELFGE
jgi:hypothetical protein